MTPTEVALVSILLTSNIFSVRDVSRTLPNIQDEVFAKIAFSQKAPSKVFDRNLRTWG